MSAQQHYDLAKELAIFRNKGILIIGSGNMVHNLGMVAWNKLHDTYGFEWAIEAGEKMKKFILNGDHEQLINYRFQGRAFDLAIPTPDHYLPLLYAVALQDKDDTVTIFNDKPVGGSLTMTSVKFG
jgi:4,5-DOPA dioxygenase extradiol